MARINCQRQPRVRVGESIASQSRMVYIREHIRFLDVTSKMVWDILGLMINVYRYVFKYIYIYIYGAYTFVCFFAHKQSLKQIENWNPCEIVIHFFSQLFWVTIFVSIHTHYVMVMQETHQA